MYLLGELVSAANGLSVPLYICRPGNSVTSKLSLQAHEIRERGGTAESIQCDVSDDSAQVGLSLSKSEQTFLSLAFYLSVTCFTAGKDVHATLATLRKARHCRAERWHRRTK